MAKREPMLLMPQKHELTTQDAANFLNVSRPFVVKEIEAGNLACRLVGAHRRIEFQELRRYMAEQMKRSEENFKSSPLFRKTLAWGRDRYTARRLSPSIADGSKSATTFSIAHLIKSLMASDR